MKLSSVSAALLCGITASSPALAYSDASPFFFFSTAPDISIPSSGLQSASSLQSHVASALSRCATDYYILVTQPGVHLSDYSNDRSFPRLRDLVSKRDSTVRSSATVKEVIDDISVTQGPSSLVDTLQSHCHANPIVIDASQGAIRGVDPSAQRPLAIQLDFKTPPPPPSASSERVEQLYENDGTLAAMIQLLPTSNYTVIYTTTPPADHHHHHDASLGGIKDSTDRLMHAIENFMEEADPMHLISKRDGEKKPASTAPASAGGLFQRYQFLSPGIFMGFLGGSIFLLVIYVAINALAGLQISYASFSRENGPQPEGKKAQ